jgi:hypothetical protein
MYGIGDELWIRIERFMEVDELRLSDASYGLDSLLNFLLPLLRAAFKARVVVSDGREECDDDAALRVLLAQSVDESEVVAHELVAIVGPVARVGVRAGIGHLTEFHREKSFPGRESPFQYYAHLITFGPKKKDFEHM